MQAVDLGLKAKYPYLLRSIPSYKEQVFFFIIHSFFFFLFFTYSNVKGQVLKAFMPTFNWYWGTVIATANTYLYFFIISFVSLYFFFKKSIWLIINMELMRGHSCWPIWRLQVLISDNKLLIWKGLTFQELYAFLLSFPSFLPFLLFVSLSFISFLFFLYIVIIIILDKQFDWKCSNDPHSSYVHRPRDRISFPRIH